MSKNNTDNKLDDDTAEVFAELDITFNSLVPSEEWIDTGSMVLNALISGSLYKGVPVGRVIQFAGPSQTFKSGFVQQILANAQKMGKSIVLFDTENAIIDESATKLGLDITRVARPSVTSIEGCRNKIYNFLKKAKEKGHYGRYVIAIDSIANMISEMETKRMGDDNNAADMGTFAKAIKSLLKVCTVMGAQTGTTFLITNHVYDNPTQMYPSLEMNMAGGKSAVYLPSVTVQLARQLEKDDKINNKVDTKLATSQKNYSGVIIRALTVKNRYIKQYLEGNMYLSFSRGLDKYYGLLEIMNGMGVVEQKGATYTDWEGNKLGYQKNFRNDKDLWEGRLIPELEKRIMSEWAYGSGMDTVDEAPEENFGEDETPSSPLENLKKLKRKVSTALDEMEEND